MRLTDRVAVVTGGSSGIGRAIALRFAAEGAFVVSGDVTREPREGGETTEALLGERGCHVDADVSRWDDVDRLVGTTVERFGRLDVMVCNAGIAGRYSKPLLETTEEDWDAIMAVNLPGVFLCCKRAIAQMVDQEPIDEVRGRVVNMTRQLAVDYGPRGVLVNAVAPGKILTGSPEQQNEETLAYSHARTPFFRLGRPEDVAGAAVFLASNDAGYVSGVN